MARTIRQVTYVFPEEEKLIKEYAESQQRPVSFILRQVILEKAKEYKEQQQQ